MKIPPYFCILNNKHMKFLKVKKVNGVEIMLNLYEVLTFRPLERKIKSDSDNETVEWDSDFDNIIKTVMVTFRNHYNTPIELALSYDELSEKLYNHNCIINT